MVYAKKKMKKMISRLLCWINCHEYKWQEKGETWMVRKNFGMSYYDSQKDYYEYKRGVNIGTCIHCGFVKKKYLND
jgi:hypothetical protein